MEKTKEICHVRIDADQVNQMRELALIFSATRKIKLEWPHILREAIDQYLDRQASFIEKYNLKMAELKEDN